MAVVGQPLTMAAPGSYAVLSDPDNRLDISVLFWARGWCAAHQQCALSGGWPGLVQTAEEVCQRRESNGLAKQASVDIGWERDLPMHVWSGVVIWAN
jgi:hypothetical protein